MILVRVPYHVAGLRERKRPRFTARRIKSPEPKRWAGPQVDQHGERQWGHPDVAGNATDLMILVA